MIIFATKSSKKKGDEYEEKKNFSVYFSFSYNRILLVVSEKLAISSSLKYDRTFSLGASGLLFVMPTLDGCSFFMASSLGCRKDGMLLDW